MVRPRISTVAVHVAGVVGASSVRAIVYASATFLALGRGGRPPYWTYTLRIAIAWLPIALLLYSAVVAGGVALALRRADQARERRAAALEVELARAELRSLRAQLHPHFLFNSLHSIAALVRARENDTAVDSIAVLGELLRESLVRARPDEVLLDEELSFVRRYLTIEQLRFGDRLTVNWNVDSEASRAKVPSFVLHSLVENAIRHGIARRPGSGRVDITIARSQSLLTVSVLDDGPGLAAAESTTATIADLSSSGTGLRSIETRLRHLYGDRALLHVRERAEGGALAEVRLPFLLEAT